MRVRSFHFFLTGGLGGLAGFLLMELPYHTLLSGGSRLAQIFFMSLYFAGFGMAVGGALGMTEGWLKKDRKTLRYGLAVGAILGLAGGFAGGFAGQVIYGLMPARHAESSNVDVAIALDSSSSMRQGFWIFVRGNDVDGRRREAAKEMVDRLGRSDRVAIVDFDDASHVLLPLTALESKKARRAAHAAIERVDDNGGTNLSAGIDASIAQLGNGHGDDGRRQVVVFLTDGVGHFDPASVEKAKAAGVAVHVIGLGSEVNGAQLEQAIAKPTGGSYYPVKNASRLSVIFEQIYTAHINMVSSAGPAGGGAQSPLRQILRVLSWLAMGLAIGLGQGVRENTREDLRACTFGGLIGGAAGGAVFAALDVALGLGSGVFGRLLSGVIVGASIGGSMRIAQTHMVPVDEGSTSTLLSFLPEKGSSIAFQSDTPKPRAARSPDPSAERQPLHTYRERYPDRNEAMAMAHRAGYSTGRIAEEFGVHSSRVERAIERFES